MSEEMFVSVNQLIEMSAMRGQPYDHVVIESSGISEPKAVRTLFQDAESYGAQLMRKVRTSDAAKANFVLKCLRPENEVGVYTVTVTHTHPSSRKGSGIPGAPEQPEQGKRSFDVRGKFQG